MRLVPLSVALVFALVACDRGPEDDSDTDVETDTDTDTDTDSDTDTDTDTDTDADLTPCDPPTTPFYGKLEESQVSSTAYTHDAGLAAVAAALPTAHVDGDPTPLDLQVTGAVVSMTGWRPADGDLWSLWVSDANASVHLYLADTPITEMVTPGQVISFRVTAGSNYEGEPEVTSIADLVIDDATAGPVYVQDVTAVAELSDAEYGREVIRTYGRILDVPAECGGGWVCSDWLTAGGQTIPFRIKEAKGVVQGDCIEAIAPLGYHKGEVQMNVDDFDWVEFF